ncbi:DUF2878 domain-containing protein [Pandoraea sputorum]|uniref:DUF2878 domain-containing protein n=1 Tax=Pandoraea sputorum TaxID=93222 RepID=UPI00123FEA6C|nr:DUF2878 domain-containing protein [Pandoraea sputorum]BET13437.1 DUF2878 domain-containing protein [Pandoraea sputorum]VVE82374.1 hypothetical protein PSP31120_03602 [Pandoraea sputorum]
MPPAYWRALYLVLGQIGWLICVLSAAHGQAWIGVVFVTLLVAGHLSAMRDAAREAMFVAFVALAGWGWESLVVRSGWLVYPAGSWPTGYAPYWMSGLWALFAIQINPLFSSLRPHWVLASLLGAVGGPLSFRAGAALGAVTFIHPWAAVAVMAGGWAVHFPALLWLAGRTGSAPLWRDADRSGSVSANKSGDKRRQSEYHGTNISD